MQVIIEEYIVGFSLSEIRIFTLEQLSEQWKKKKKNVHIKHPYYDEVIIGKYTGKRQM